MQGSPNLQTLLEQEARAFEPLNLLWHDIQQAHVLRRPGSSALLNHLNYAQSVLRKMRRIVTRYCEQLELSHELWAASERLRLTGNVGFSQPLTDYGKVTDYLVIDFESVYQLAGILLDQWTTIVRHIAGVGDGKGQNFNKFVTQMKKQHPQAGLTKILYDQFQRQLRWIHSNVLIVRDNFIVHYESPWQRSILNYQEDISLGISLSPDWAGVKKIGNCEDRIRQLASKTSCGPTAEYTIESLHRYSENPRYIFSHMMWFFGDFDELEQSEMMSIAKEFGFTTPPFKFLVENLFAFIEQTMNVTRTYARQNASQTLLGLGEGEHFPFPIPPGESDKH